MFTGRRVHGLATAGKDVVYSITLLNGNATDVTARLFKGVSSGRINQEIQKSLPDATTTILLIQDTSVMSAPTQFPSSVTADIVNNANVAASSPKVSNGIVVGAAVAGIGFIAIMSIVTYCFCTRGKRKGDFCGCCSRRTDRPSLPRTLVIEETGCRSAEGTQSIFVMDNTSYVR